MVISKLRNSVSTEWTFPHHGFTEIFDLKHGKDFSVKKNKTRIFQWLRDASQKKNFNKLKFFFSVPLTKTRKMNGIKKIPFRVLGSVIISLF